MIAVTALTLGSFEGEVLQSPLPVVVKFGAPWCGPCKPLDVILEASACEYEDRVKFTTVNVDDESELAKTFGVRGVPTMMLFDKGQFVTRIPNLRTKGDLGNFLNKHL